MNFIFIPVTSPAPHGVQGKQRGFLTGQIRNLFCEQKAPYLTLGMGPFYFEGFVLTFIWIMNIANFLDSRVQNMHNASIHIRGTG